MKSVRQNELVNVRSGRQRSLQKLLLKNMIIFFLIAGSLALVSGVVQQVTNSTNIRIRLRYLGKMSRKMQTMEYKYVEDSSFQEKNYKALNACNNNADGVEGVYNTICKMPAELLTVVGMMVMVCFLNPVILVVLALHTAAIMWASRKSHNYRYNKKEDIAKATRKMKYYSDTTNNFAFGKDIRIFNLRDRILSNYRIEIDAYTSLMKNIFKKEWLYGLLGVVTMLISNVAMYGLRVGVGSDYALIVPEQFFRKFFGVLMRLQWTDVIFSRAR